MVGRIGQRHDCNEASRSRFHTPQNVWGFTRATSRARPGRRGADSCRGVQSVHIRSTGGQHCEKLEGQDVEISMQDAKESVAGMDQLAPADFKLLSDRAYQDSARMLSMIEAGSAWPGSLQTASAARMPKDLDDSRKPLAYRALPMLHDVPDVDADEATAFPAMGGGINEERSVCSVGAQRAADAAYKATLRD